MYPGLFVMVADDISLSSFSINGELGADGGGQVDSYQYTPIGLSPSLSSGYTAYVKRVWYAGDGGNIIIPTPYNSEDIDNSISKLSFFNLEGQLIDSISSYGYI